MRETLFKGKRIDNDWWAHGYAVKHGECWWIYTGKISTIEGRVNEYGLPLTRAEKYEVCPETICQYTGLPDKNGKKIFKGDIIKYTDEITGKEKIAQIEYCEKQASFVRVYKSKMGLQYLYINERIANKSELIGNIFDNPELLTED